MLNKNFGYAKRELCLPNLTLITKILKASNFHNSHAYSWLSVILFVIYF